MSQLSSGDSIQAQLTRYFSSLPLSNQSTNLPPQQIGLLGDSTTRIVSDRVDGIDKAVRRKSYPHEANTSSMLNSLFGSKDCVEEVRFSDPFPCIDESFTFEPFSVNTNSTSSEKLHRDFGQPNPQAPEFIPQRSRLNQNGERKTIN